MGDPPRLPTFFVIGASKSGTTSLRAYLDLHPEIEMTTVPEPHLVIGPGWRARSRAYPELFRGETDIRGDRSTGYSNHAVNPDAPANIAELVPEARLIYVVRDPVERTIAHYAQHLIRGDERRPIGVAIQPDDPENVYLGASRYASVVESYLRCFDPERLLVLDLADLRDRRRQSLERVFRHVGADPAFWDEGFATEHNVRAEDNLRLPRSWRRLRQGRLDRASRRVLPDGLRRNITAGMRRAIGHQVRPEASPEFRARLTEALAPEVERLRRLTGQGFEGWST
jgi:Sulfotransferase family